MDDLKAKLAAQEVELKQKNEDADKLIQARTCSLFRHTIKKITVNLNVLSYCTAPPVVSSHADNLDLSCSAFKM